MGHQRQNLFRALSTLNTLLILVFILFLIEKLNLSYLLKFGFVFAFLIIAFLKIYCMSAIGGAILEVLSSQEPVVQIRRFHQNVKDLGTRFLFVFVIVYILDFMLFALFPLFRAWRPLYFSFLEAVAAYVLARWAIQKKYMASLSAPRQKAFFDLGFLGVMITAFLLEFILVRFSDLIHFGAFRGTSVVSFAVNYIHIFEFIFCSLHILDDYPQINAEFSNSREIFLVNPMSSGVVQSLEYWFLRGCPPAFVVLKALSPKTYKFREFNRVMWYERYYKKDVLVCITCFTSNCYEAYKIAKEFKKRGAKVVMGGPHVTYLPQEALAFCDSVVIGQAEGIWGQLIRDYEKEELKPQYSGIATEANYAQVQQELLSSPPYVVKEFLETIRGCKFRCHFCTVPALSGGRVRPAPISDFVEVIKKIRPFYRDFAFIDNNIYSDPAYAKDLFAALKPLNIKWRSACSVDIAANQETLQLAKESGCSELLIGYEVSGASLEKDQGGKFAMAQKYLEYTKIIKKAGIKIKGHFIFGFDSDSLKTLFQLWRFCFSIMPRFTVVSMLTPLPGSGVYQDMLDQNRIINLNWRSYALKRMVVRHPHMNHAVMSFFFPLIQALFLMTTSSFGFLLLVFCCTVPFCVDKLFS